MPRFQSSLVDSQRPFSPAHGSLTHLLLSDPMNDRSKDCAPRGTLRGSWGSWTATLSHTVGTRHQLVVVQGFFYVLCCRYHADRFRCSLGLLCSHAPTKRVPGLNACPWLPVEGGTGSRSQEFHTSMHTVIHTAVIHAPRSARTEAESSSLHGVRMLLLNIFTSLRAQVGGEGSGAARQGKGHSKAIYITLAGEGRAGSVGATCRSGEQHAPFR